MEDGCGLLGAARRSILPVATTGERVAASESLPVVKGTVDLIVLKALSWGPMHGFGISSWLETQTSGSLVMDDGALYQVLHRLEARELVEPEWGVTENNRKARYYKLTPAGRRYLREETAQWLRSSGAVTSLLTLTSRSATG
jgi:PadR family transcriptional regulator, regulatory protein PadR